MNRVIAFTALLAALLLAGCNDSASTDASTSANNTAPQILDTADASSGAPEVAVIKADYKLQAGTELELSKDEKVMVVSVADLDAKSNDMEGLVAIEGKVVESYPDKGTIILVDVVDSGCGDDCATCPRARVPVRLGQAEGEEKLTVPGVDDVVIVFADLTRTETGYTLAVRELRKVG